MGLSWLTLLLTTASAMSAAYVGEEFPDDPTLSGRFIRLTNNTESSFPYNSSNGTLQAVLDMDQSIAYCLSAPPFAALTGREDVSFSFNFKVLALDERVLPSVFVGLLSTNHVNLEGDGLAVVFSTTNQMPVASAAVDQGLVNAGGQSILLALQTHYLAVGRYSTNTQQFTVEIYGGSDFTRLIGSSTAWATHRVAPPRFTVDRLGLQNGGAQWFDQTNGSITLEVDNLFLPARPPAYLSITNVLIEGNSGLTNLCLELLLSTPSDTNVWADFSVSDDSARMPDDYLLTNGTVFIPAGTMLQLHCVTVIGERLYEGTETLVICLTNALLANTNGLGTILDEDPPEATVSDAQVEEGDVGTNYLAFVVSLSSVPDSSASVDFYTLGETATAGSDYEAQTGTLAFGPGRTTHTVLIPVFGDVVTELSETLFLCLTNSHEVKLLRPNGQGIILNDDDPCIFISNVEVAEPQDGNTSAVFTVWLEHASDLVVSVDYAVSNQTARAGFDYVGQSGTLVFLPGVTNTNIVVAVRNDLEVEPVETFAVSLGNTNNARLCEPRGGIGTIHDGTVPPTIDLEATVVDEGNTGTVNAIFRASLSRPSSQTVRVNYATADGAALAGSDYAATNGQITFPPGITSATFVVLVHGDCRFEENEFFWATLTNAQLATLGTAQNVGMILSDDSPPTLNGADAAVRERDLESTNLVLRLLLSCPSSFTAMVHYATSDGTALAGTDYLGSNGTVVFPPDVTNAAITVQVLGDLKHESNEAFFVDLSNPTGLDLATNQLMGTILNDDDLRIHLSPVTVYEPSAGSTNARFELTLSEPPSSEVRVDFTTADGTATAGRDYLSTNPNVLFTNGTIRFPAWTTNQAALIPVFSDSEDESNETFFVNLGNPFHAELAVTQAAGTIIDGDPPCLTIHDTVAGDDGTGRMETRFLVTLSSTSSLPISVSYFTTNGTAIPGLDYVSASGVLIFAPGVTSTHLDVQIYGNTLLETNEYFFVVLERATNATLCKPVGTCTIVTRSNEPPVVRLVAPEPGLCLTTPTNLLLAAEASDSDGRILRVNFFADGTKLGEVYEPPYELTWFNVPAGDYKLTAVAQDNLMTNAVSAPVHLAASPPAVISIGDRSVVEGDVGTKAVFTLSLASPSCRTVMVEVATSDRTALAGSDYLAVGPTNVVFEPGMTSLPFSVPILGDTLIEPDETLFVCLTNPVNASLDRTCALGTILTDDANLPPAIRILSPADGSVYYATESVPILAEAWDTNGTIKKVDFYANNLPLGSVLSLDPAKTRFDVDWSEPAEGRYALVAMATDDGGAMTMSSPVTTEVRRCVFDLVASPLTNQTVCACGTAVFNTTAFSYLPVQFAWQFNGEVISGETNSSLVLYSLRSAQEGIYSVTVSTSCQALTHSALLGIQGEGMPNPLLLTNSTRISIGDSDPALGTIGTEPYPSSIGVNCLPGPVTNLAVTIHRLRHAFPGDLDMVLLSPRGQAIKLMSDAGNELGLTNATLTFTDNATLPLPQYDQITSGSYLPTEYDSSTDWIPLLPSGLLYASQLAKLGPTNANGLWQLYVMDDAWYDYGGVEAGWSLELYWDDSPARLSLPEPAGAGWAQLTLTSHPGQTHVIEASTNQLDWISVSTNVTEQATAELVVPTLAPDSLPAYRVIRCPCMSFFREDCFPCLSEAAYQEGVGLEATLAGPPGATYVILESSDLETWVPVSTNILDGKSIRLSIPVIRNAHRFYRAAMMP